MPLPPFDLKGDLPEGIYVAALEEILERFGKETEQRKDVSLRLQHIYATAQRTGKLTRLLIFGSYVTNKPDPNDVDVVLIMADDFRVEVQPEEIASLFDHKYMENTFGASIFWVRPSMLLEPLESFRRGWQTKRNGKLRGIVEIAT